jgi:NAD(P)-dependent dehydrogenase (short-subunit alcohol dehydrogenase family)
MEFERQTAVVTGAGSGIGRATARRLAAGGARVVVQDVSEEGAAETIAAIEAAGGAALACICTVADEAALRAAVEDIGGRVAILVNNAGVPGYNAALEAIDYEAYRRLFDVHVWGTIAATRAVLPGMKAAGFGRIVNIASNRGQVGFERSSHYGAAKAAVTGLAKSWARELAAFGILVNAVAPGVVRTGMTLGYGEASVAAEAELNLVKRWAEPEEMAEWIAFLAGPKGSFMTGQLLCPNGGDPIVGI